MSATEWKHTACILCECNCGIEVQLEGRSLAKIRGDKAHPASLGWRDPIALTPWHKHVLARVEAL